MRTFSRLCLAAWLITASVSDAIAQEQPSAVELAVERGEALFSAQNYGAALAEFGVAYRLLEGDPRRFAVLGNLAACHERLFHYDVAIALYRDYLRQGGARVEDREAIEARVQTLDRLLATVTIASNVPAEIWVEDRKVGRAPSTIRIAPGKKMIELRAPLHEASRREVDLSVESVARLEFQLEELSQYSGLSPAYFWSFAALTAGAIGVGAGFGIAALNADSEGKARARRDRYLNTPDDERDVARTAAAADIAFLGAAVLGASATVLFFLTDWGGSPEREPAALTPVAQVEPTAWQVGVRGAL